jgi:hypothetical protein
MADDNHASGSHTGKMKTDPLEEWMDRFYIKFSKYEQWHKQAIKDADAKGEERPQFWFHLTSFSTYHTKDNRIVDVDSQSCMMYMPTYDKDLQRFIKLFEKDHHWHAIRTYFYAGYSAIIR